jgi:amino acid permease
MAPKKLSTSAPRGEVVYNALRNDEVSTLELADMNNRQWKDEIASTTGIDILPSPEHDLLGQSSFASMYVSLTSTILGAGMLGLPYAFAHLGWILGTAMLGLCGAAAALSLFYLAKCAKKTTAPSSFYKVASIATPKFAFIIDLIISLKCFGVATSYIIVTGDLLPQAMVQVFPSAHPFMHSRSFAVGASFVIVGPLSCLRSLDSLRWTSGLSGVFLALVVALSLAYAVPGLSGLDACHADSPSPSLSDCHGSHALAILSPSALHVVPIIIFGYACQQNAFTVVNELREPSAQRINALFAASIATAFIVYVLTASAGYYVYGDNVKSNILASYPQTRITSIARLFISLVVIFHYPLQAHPFRKCCMGLLAHATGGGAEPNDRTTYYRRYVAITAAFLMFSLVIALSCSNLGLALSIVGATGSTAIGYVLPGLFYYRMHTTWRGAGAGAAPVEEGEGPQWLRTLSWYLCAVGLVLIPVCLLAIVLSQNSPAGPE